MTAVAVTDACYYFGCWNEAGHYLFAPTKRWKRPVHHREERPVVYFGAQQHLDGTLAPRRLRPQTRWYRHLPVDSPTLVWSGMGSTQEECRQIGRDSEELPQGQFLRHELDNGFTAIQWWDRTQGDDRGACSSTVLLKGKHTSAEMLAALAEHFPHVLANLAKAGVELVEIHYPGPGPLSAAEAKKEGSE